MNSTDRAAIREALQELPATCRYHGTEFGFLGWERPAGPPRCDSCKPAWRRERALAALDRQVSGVSIQVNTPPAQDFLPPSAVLAEVAAWERRTGRRLGG